LPPTSPDDLWQRATARWAEIAAILPDLAPAVALQQRLLRLIINAAERLDQPLPVSLTADSVIEKWGRGVPALRNEPVPIPGGLKDTLPELCNALADGGASDSAIHIRDAILDQRIDAGSLLSVSLARNQKAIRTSALHMGLSPDLVWLVGELGSCPLAYHLQTRLSADPDIWDRGYCPSCGSWPTFIETRDTIRALRCSFCAFAWDLRSRRCIYCGNSGDDFVVAAPDVNRGDRSVELCSKCGNYTKAIEVAEATPFPLLAIEDLASMDLDQAAMTRGYRRPALYDLDAIEPIRAC
jgi:formate dehydrogenase maturation protein FdhE